MSEKLHRLENERSSLNLQIQVLSEQLEVQRDIIHPYDQYQRQINSKTKYRQGNFNSNPNHFLGQPTPPSPLHSAVGFGIHHPQATFVHRVCPPIEFVMTSSKQTRVRDRQTQ